MKKLLFASLLAFAACSSDKTDKQAAPAVVSPQDKAKQNIEAQVLGYVKKSANDPASYQKIETRITDTLYLADNLAKVLDFYESGIKSSKELGLEPDKEDIAKIPGVKAKLDSLKAAPQPNPIFGYRFEHDYRIKNEFGALVKQTMFIATDKDLKFLQAVGRYGDTNKMYF